MLTRLPLARLPTPVEPLPRLSRHLGVEVWVKRDDLTGLGLTGNKVRKLELLLGDAQEQGADVVLTTGGLQSNHCRATAVAARRLGWDVVLLLRGALEGAPEGNLLLDRLLGAELHTCTPEDYRTRRDALLDALAAEQTQRGRRPYVIPEGGSNGIGALAYVRAARELGAQGTPHFDAVVVAVGSGGTVCGLAQELRGPEVVGVAVCDDEATFRARVEGIGAEAEQIGGPALPAYGDGWRITDAYRGPAYGVATPEVWEVIRTVARLEGLLLDPVYTGKAMTGLFAEARAGRLGSRCLFWHTGGVFGLFGRGAEAVAG